jgi:excisionase family DNA binding protein
MKLDPQGPGAPTFYTVEEVAEQLGVSLATIRRAIRDGRLATHRFGRAVRIAADDLETFLANART